MNFPKDISTWCEWLEWIATNHKALCHGEGEGKRLDAFSTVYISSDPFKKVDYRGWYKKMNVNLKYPHLLNLGVDFDMSEDMCRMIAKGRFTVLCKIDVKDKSEAAIKACYAEAETIARKIVAFAGAYFSANSAWGSIIGDTSTEPIGPISVDGDLYGVTVELKYKVNTIGVCYDIDEWKLPIPEVTK